MENVEQKAKLLAETIAMLRAVLISSPLGVKFDKLYRDYKQLTGKTILYRELGFQKLEFFIQSIPDVARAERGADGEWILRGIASEADRHVAKLISKQKKPKVRKSAKYMISRNVSRPRPEPARFNTPVKQSRRPPFQSQRYIAPRFQKLQPNTQSREKNTASYRPTTTVGPTDLRHKIRGSDNEPTKRKVIISGNQSDGNFGGPMFQKVSENVRVSRTGSGKRDVTSFRSNDTQNLQEKGKSQGPSTAVHNMSISITNKKSGQSTRTVTTTSPPKRHTSAILEDPVVVKWIKAEIAKTPNGLWATRLAVLYEEKFKEKMSDLDFQELKLRPDIVRVDEIIVGRMLLYSSLPIYQDKRASEEKAPTPKETVMPRQTEILDVVLPCDLPGVGSICMVYISNVKNVGCFYVSKSDSISETLNMDILKQYESTKYNADDISSIAPDQVFCAQFIEDRCFYRARILQVVDSKSVRVLYVDFGNQEVINVEHLRILKKEFHSQPVQAFQCCLDGVQAANEDQEWSEAALEKFNELTSDKELKMTVKDSEGKVLSVCLYDEASKSDVGEELAKAAVASPIKNLASTPSSSSSSLSSSSGTASEKITLTKKDGMSRSRRVKSKSPGIVDIPLVSYIDVLVCNITGTYNVYLRLIGDEYSNKVEAIQESMTSYYSDSKDEVVTEPVAGDLFALLCEEVWCRVKVLSVNGPTIKVFFVDHGDTAETSKSELRILAPQFQELPLQVFQCALHGLPKTKNPDLVDKLQKLCMGEDCVAHVIKRSPNLIFVELIDTSSEADLVVNDVIRKLVIQDEELKPVLPKAGGEQVEVYVPYISPSGKVYLNVLGAGIKRLEELNKDLTEYYFETRAKAIEFVSNPIVDKVYCAKCDKDSNWYRAKIISASNKEAVEVLYVDYGNTDTVPSTNLREPTQAIDHVLSLPFQALECQLYDIPKDDWNEDFAKYVLDILSHGVVTAEVISEGDVPSVSLLLTVAGSDDEERLPERLTSFLGTHDDEDDIKDAIESGQDVDKTVRVNGDREDNDESDKNSESKLANVDKKDGKNVTEEDRGNVAEDEKNVAVDETNVVVEEKNVAVDEKDVSVDEENVAVDEKDVAEDEKDVAEDEKDVAVVEKNVPVDEENVAVDEKNVAVDEKDVAEDEKDVSVDETNVAVVEKNVAVDEKNVPVDEENVAVDEENVAVDEKDVSVDEENVAVDEKDVSVDEKNVAVAEKNVAVDEKNVPVEEINVGGDDGENVAIEEGEFGVNVKTAVANDVIEANIDSAQDTQKIGNDAADVEGAVASEPVVKPIPGKELPLVSGKWMDVVVTDVKDPEHFTFQLLANVNELYALEDKMNDYYQKNPAVEEPLVEGGVYAACMEDGLCWYRVTIEDFMKGHKVYVHFLDYGNGVVVAEGENIRRLQEDFLLLPFQSVVGSLVGVQSPKAKWSKECIKSFKSCTLNKHLVAKVTSGHTSYHHLKKTLPVLIELYDTSDPTKDVSIAEKLVEEKFANAPNQLDKGE